ncbi:hypothetical protein C492_21355, partial [Natronococcus jeotgali DSM 18795]
MITMAGNFYSVRCGDCENEQTVSCLLYTSLMA